jgi:hypothetical protein
MNTAQRIALLQQEIPFRSYLEIGVSAGATFKNVSVPQKVAVDPHFRFNYRSTANEHFYEIPSDTYFARLVPSKKFDLIFIDGLHHAEQVLKDFDNALKHSHDGTLIIVDDVYPCDEFSVLRDQDEAVSLRMLKRKDSPAPRAWHGDVFKAAFDIALNYERISYVTITEGYGNPQMLCWLQERVLPEWALDKSLDSLTYQDFIKHRGLLNLQPEIPALRMAMLALKASGAYRG